MCIRDSIKALVQSGVKLLDIKLLLCILVSVRWVWYKLAAGSLASILAAYRLVKADAFPERVVLLPLRAPADHIKRCV